MIRDEKASYAEKVLLAVYVPGDLAKKIDLYRIEHDFPNRGAFFRHLISQALESNGNAGNNGRS